MARGYYRDQVANAAGDVLPGAQVLIVDKGTSTPVNFLLYAADEPDTTPLGNPLLTNEQGEFAFWHPLDGAYDALVTCAGYPSVRETLQLVIPGSAAVAQETAARIAADAAHVAAVDPHAGYLFAGEAEPIGTAAAGDAAHVAAVDPHPAYLTQAEGDARYATGGAYDPAGTAAAGDAAHVAAGDPHPAYLTQAEGDVRYDAIGAASSGDTAHAAAADPHPVYLTLAEADARYAPIGGGGGGGAGVDTELRAYVQQIMAVIDPGGPPPP